MDDTPVPQLLCVLTSPCSDCNFWNLASQGLPRVALLEPQGRSETTTFLAETSASQFTADIKKFEAKIKDVQADQPGTAFAKQMSASPLVCLASYPQSDSQGCGGSTFGF